MAPAKANGKKKMKFAAWSEWDIVDYMNIQNSKKSKIIFKKGDNLKNLNLRTAKIDKFGKRS